MESEHTAKTLQIALGSYDRKLEFLMNIRSMDPKPNVVLFDEGRRQNTSAICLESGDGFCYVGHAELKNLLWELYRLPGRQSQRMERKCQELSEGWGI